MRYAIALALLTTLLTACEFERIRYVQACPKRLYMPACMKDYLRGNGDALCPDGVEYLKDLTTQQERLPQ